MNDSWIEFAIRIQSIAQAGLTVKSERIIAFQDWRKQKSIFLIKKICHLILLKKNVQKNKFSCASILMKIQTLQHCLIKTKVTSNENWYRESRMECNY